MKKLFAARAWLVSLAAVVFAACGGSGSAPEPTGVAAAPPVAAANDDPGASAFTDRGEARKTAQASAAVLAFRGNGWYWNPNEGGTGFMFEAQGNRGFVAFFMYEEGSGKPLWYAAEGPFVANPDGSFVFNGDLRYYTAGQPVESGTYVSPQSRSIGSVQMQFSGDRVTAQLPGRRIDGTRFNFAGLGGTTSASQPEVGWYYDPAQGGRGYALEVQNNRLFMAMFHYNQDGSPTWNVVEGDLTSGTLTQPFQIFAGGQTLTSAYVSPPHRHDLGAFTVSFRNACAGQVKLAGAPPVSIRRFVFGDQPAGAECRSASATAALDVPGLEAGPVRMLPGDLVYGRIDAVGDVDVYGIALRAGETYRFELKGVDGRAGTLADPVLTLYDDRLTRLAENNDQATGVRDSALSFYAPVSGTYYLSARARASETGSFLLTASGFAPALAMPDAMPASAYAGALESTLFGGRDGTARLTIDAAGVVSGSVAWATGGTVPVQGQVSAGGLVAISAPGWTFSGFIDPQGKLMGSWSGAGSAGAMVGRGPVAANAARQLTVRARASLAGGVGPTMVVRVNGVAIGSTVVQATTPTDHVFPVADLPSGAKVDVVFTNDAVIAGEDRNLFIAYVTDGRVTVLPSTPGASVDRGSAERAFDGVDVIAGQGDLYWNAALRLSWPAAPADEAGLAARYAASRLLQQASFGPTLAEIDRVASMGEGAWINEQLALPVTNDYVPEVQRLYDLSANNRPFGSTYDSTTPVRRFWGTVAGSPDQLRKRVAFALHQIFMVSQADSNLYEHTRAYANYLDTLNRHAFGNYRALLEDISLSPVMGIYLSHIRNRRENAATGQLPDENYAREVMQLFSIGLQELNLDGSLRLDANGKPIETYNNADVMAFAKVFTGWSWGFPDAQLTESNFRWGNPKYTVAADALIDLQPMKAYPGQHSTSAKPLFAGKPHAVTIPANTSPAESLRIALDSLFNHPNVGPFLGRQLIQRLTTSHPSPAYVARVAAVFNNNGRGVRGDLGAVTRAILLDPEARSAPAAGFGKLKEPILRVAHWMRAFGATSATGNFLMVYELDGLNQRPYNAPSVFSYFRPGYIPPNTVLAETASTAPEFQIVNESTTPAWVNLAENMAGGGIGWTGSARDVVPSMTALSTMSAAGDVDGMIRQINLLLFAGRLPPALRQDILDAVTGVGGSDAASHLNRARVAVFMALASPEFLVQR